MSEGSKFKDLSVTLVGENGVGKTSIINQLIDKIFLQDPESTTAGKLSTKTFIYNGNKLLKLEIWDTAGQERYRSLTKMFYKEASVAIMVYDITRKQTYEEIKNYWADEISNNAPENIIKVLCANKSDLIDDETVDETEAREYAKSIGALFHQTSAKNSYGINELFLDIAKKATNDENVKIKEDGENDEGENEAVDEEPQDKFGSVKISKKQDMKKPKKGCC